jgi:hypothetical protein
MKNKFIIPRKLNCYLNEFVSLYLPLFTQNEFSYSRSPYYVAHRSTLVYIKI